MKFRPEKFDIEQTDILRDEFVDNRCAEFHDKDDEEKLTQVCSAINELLDSVFHSVHIYAAIAQLQDTLRNADTETGTSIWADQFNIMWSHGENWLHCHRKSVAEMKECFADCDEYFEDFDWASAIIIEEETE